MVANKDQHGDCVHGGQSHESGGGGHRGNGSRGHGETAHLLSMAHDIAANLSFHDDADLRIADHINRFWAPRMRRLLLEYAEGGAADFPAPLRLALPRIRR